jgi:HSP20 family protein
MSFAKHYSNFHNTPVFSNVLENIFGRDVLTDFIGREIYNMPPANIIETATQFRIDLLAAGFQKEDFKVQIIENQLVIGAVSEKNKEEKAHKFVSKEFSQIDFKRAFTLPNSVQFENMEAKYSNGVLSVTIPKMVITPYKEEEGILVDIL